MSKKGQEGLPLSTIIVAILVVIVLVVLVAFFLGGSTALTDAIKRVFFGTTAGYDLALAIQTCESRCDIAQGMPAFSRADGAYCKTSIAVDKDPVDGEADFYRDESTNKKTTVKYYCPPSGRYTSFTEADTVKSLGMDCDLGMDKGVEIKCNPVS